MADAKYTGLPELSATPDDADIVSIIDDPAGSPISKKITIVNLIGNADPRGNHDIWIPASAMFLPVTTPATGLSSRELATNDVNIRTFDFTSTAADEHTEFTWTMPREWDAGTLTFEFFWTALGGSAGNVVWGAQAVAFDDDNPLDTAFGTIQEVTDAWIANDDLHISSATSALTVAGTPVAGEMVQFRIIRSGSDASDTFATTAELLGVRIVYITDSPTST